ncbi:MAG TPA: hypothetical protein EYN54_13785 [Methylococcaceae bacterium]|nr:hypothetical protein [Methylococcaceae bacterium]
MSQAIIHDNEAITRRDSIVFHKQLKQCHKTIKRLTLEKERLAANYHYTDLKGGSNHPYYKLVVTGLLLILFL